MLENNCHFGSETCYRRRRMMLQWWHLSKIYIILIKLVEPYHPHTKRDYPLLLYFLIKWYCPFVVFIRFHFNFIFFWLNWILILHKYFYISIQWPWTKSNCIYLQYGSECKIDSIIHYLHYCTQNINGF